MINPDEFIEKHYILRPALLIRLSDSKYDNVWKIVSEFFNGDEDAEKEYWDYVFNLPDQWQGMAKGTTQAVADAVQEIVNQAESLAAKIVAFRKEIETVKGFGDMVTHLMMAEQLRDYANHLRQPTQPTEAVQVRPRGMGKDSAERTYYARALTAFLLSGGQKAGSKVVANTVCALLDIGRDDEFDDKDVRDLTEDIVQEYKQRQNIH